MFLKRWNYAFGRILGKLKMCDSLKFRSAYQTLLFGAQEVKNQHCGVYNYQSTMIETIFPEMTC